MISLFKKNVIIGVIVCVVILLIAFAVVFKKTAPKEPATENSTVTQEGDVQMNGNQEAKKDVIIKDGKEWQRDEFDRLVPVQKEDISVDKKELVKKIELQKGLPRVDGEWIVLRKVTQNGKEILTTEEKVFTDGETFEEQLTEMKKVLAEKDVVAVEPNYTIPAPKPIGSEGININIK